MSWGRHTHECPQCGWGLLAIGFCMHVDQQGNTIAVFDAVPAGSGGKLPSAISQPAPNQIGA